MASAGQELKNLTECCICLKEFTDPKMLPCIHTFCLGCINQTVETAGKKPGEDMPCPLCRKPFIIPATGINDLPKNFFMENLMSVTTTLSLSSRLVKPCDVCTFISAAQNEGTKDATMRCLECGDNFCDFCSQAHKLQKLSREHHIVKIGSETKDDIRKMSPAKYCNDHKQKLLDYYCPECRRLVCISCLLEKHVSHNCKDVTTVEEEFRQTIEKNASTIAGNAEELLTKRSKIDHRKAQFLTELEDIECEIQRRSQELREIIDKHETSLLEKISLMKQNQLKRYQEEGEEIERFHTIFKSFEAYSTELCSKGSAGDICGSFHELLRRGEELMKDHDEYLDRPLETIKVSFKMRDLDKLQDVDDKNIVGQIQETVSRCKTCATVVGFCHKGSEPTSDVVTINLHRPNKVSNLQKLPTEMVIEAAAAVYADILYVIGLGGNYDEIWKYELSIGWIKCTSLVQGRRKHSAAFVDEVLYICGGFVDHNKSVLKSVVAYNTFTRHRCITVGQLCHGVRSSGGCVRFRNSLYIFGSLDKDFNHVSHVQIYNTEQNNCTLLSKAIPVALALMRAVVWETSAILFGHKTCLIFNFETETWQEREQFKTDVIHFGLVLENDRVFVIGGGINEKDEDGETTWKLKDDVRYVPIQNVLEDKPIGWKTHATLPQQSMIFAYEKLTFSV